MNPTGRLLQLLTRIIQSAHAEIEQYRRIESQMAGRDIGWERAAQEWMLRHFVAWKSYHWQLAIEEAVGIQTGSNSLDNQMVYLDTELCEASR